jgi:hypothetical protein
MPATEKQIHSIDGSLEKTEAALKAIQTDLGRDAKRIARDVEKLVHNARRDMTRLSRAVRTDAEHASKAAARTRR